MRIATALTDGFGLRHPIVLAPMDLVSGGRLARAVSDAGGLGLIGGGYGDAAWLRRELDAAGGARVGVGFITWSLAKRPELLELALERRPAALMLSFGDPSPFVDRIKAAASRCSARSRRSRWRRTRRQREPTCSSDISRNNVWPAPFNGRVVRNAHAA